ncbi:MAG: hypothetical protein A2665_02130 [Candidatus Zambryskibacteria bacterium RIFCSPHIGHO2_01_FULL_46_30]|uniref:Uncharacterized protein n=1 Tax=Candidatus Zambryskibacteria bacterium RIFCSPHIGHO2_01_FULL_46_30 TaxID=1802739 RepID=A0A1G2T5L3_9BACT|nr:MAG: hypothetical protein A2665_02130 [Candidatus Zambryskibacteria bacterium RIFCSPHIGHO2_01_FULL_46_30]OHB06292.1 MAG: hypothetical protein A3B22_00175 [Candidatus Zambryskibacteria bacterium RIFCSPLOWO2_01_FULL_47_33]
MSLNTMRWFLERISARSLPISFGIKERTEYSDDFAKLVQKKILKHSSNLDAVDCGFCDGDDCHQSQVRNENGKLSYVCDNGNGTKKLTDDDVAIFDYDNGNFLKTLTDELGLSVDGGSHKDEASYSNDAFFRLGIYEDKAKKMKVEVYYLRNNDAFEPTIRFNELGNLPKMLITNTMRADLIAGKENLFTCVLSEVLAPSEKTSIFDRNTFAKCFDAIRGVRFDKKDGHLFLDNKRIYTAPLGGNHYHFLSFLWDKWMQQLPHSEIHQFIKGEAEGKPTKSETAQKFCQKMKNEIKTKCKEIDKIITTPTSGHYMMADPL